MNREHPDPQDVEEEGRQARSYLTLAGLVDAKPTFVRNLLSAAWARRIAYNAAIDPFVPFADGVAHRIALSEARRIGAKEPAEPTRSESYLPPPRSLDLYPILTELRAAHPEIERWPVSMLRIAIDEACRAGAKLVADRVAAKAEGRKPPRLHFRSASDDVDVSTESFRLSRSGDGPAVTKPKRRKAKQAEAHRLRKEAEAAAGDADFAARRRAAGMREPRVLAGLRRRAERREKERAVQAKRQVQHLAAKAERNERPPRRDSPGATIGKTRVRVEVQGLGCVRIRLSRPIPDGAEVVRVHFLKAAGEGNRVEARLVLTVPAVEPTFDELETGAAIHAVISALPLDASPLAAVEAVEAAGIPVRGDDWNVSAPSADHKGNKTKRVTVTKAELRSLKRLQEQLSHKDAVLLGAERNKPKPRPVEGEAPNKRKRPPKRSRSAMKLKRHIARIGRRLSNRATTMACQDARRLSEGVVLVASDPQRMAKPILAKGGPAERRAKAAAGIPTIVPTNEPPRGYQLNPAQQRAMRRNMHMARPGYRVRRLGLLCSTAGVIHATPGHEGTTRTCPKCEAVEAKSLDERVHDCPRCGLVMPRDQASALVTLGRALLEYREGPDPFGRVAARRTEIAAAAAKAARLREKRVEAGRKTGKARTERALTRSQSAGASPAGGAAAPSLQGVVPLSLRPSGRNIGGVPAAKPVRNSN